jgi:transcriptional regulator with XRE-family HTH domain
MKKAKQKGPNLSLKRLREALEKTQSEFADLLGVSFDLVQSVELGRAPVTEKFNRKLIIKTGASLRRRIYDKTAPPGQKFPVKFHSDGTVNNLVTRGEYTKDTYKEHLKRNLPSAENASAEVDKIVPDLKALFIAAADKIPAGQIPIASLQMDLHDWIKERSAALGLGVVLKD